MDTAKSHVARALRMAATTKTALVDSAAGQPNFDAETQPREARSGSRRAMVATVLMLYCVSGTLLTLANKVAVRAFPYPNAIACLQNVVTVVLLLAGSVAARPIFGSMPSFTRDTLREWVPLTGLFVGMLVSSLLALMHVSAVTLIVIRNLTSLTVAALEASVLGTRVPPTGVASLAGMLIGAVMYGLHDITFSAIGYAWLAFNLASTSAYQVHVKRVISSDAARAIGPLGFSYINNVLSLPMLLCVAVATGEVTRLSSMLTRGDMVSAWVAALLLASGVLGFCLSVTAFKLNTLISATSMMVANNVNKFLVIIASEVFIQRTLDAVATAGTLTVMAFGWLYSRARK